MLVNTREIEQTFHTLINQYYDELQQVKQDSNEATRIKRKYDDALDRITNSILGENVVLPIRDDVMFDRLLLHTEQTTARSITYDMLQYITANKDLIHNNGGFRDRYHDTNCLICGEYIKGVGLIDESDSGDSAICIKCINPEQHKLGGGCYFAEFN